jgi:hypothetical protein
MVACNFGISKTRLSHHLLMFQEHESPTDEYIARNYVKKIFIATQEHELVEYFKQAAKLHYNLSMKEVMKLAFQYGKENGVTTPDSWVMNECTGNMWLRRLRKRHKSWCLRKPAAISLARSVQAFFFNLKELTSRHNFTANKIYSLDETGNSTVYVPHKTICAKGSSKWSVCLLGREG